jgi:hypothetical protein
MRGDARTACAAVVAPVIRVAVISCAVAAVIACSDKSRGAQVDSSLSRDLQLATQSSVEPTFQDTALSAVAHAPSTRGNSRPATVRPVRRDRAGTPAPAPVAVVPRPAPQAAAPAPEPEPVRGPTREIASGTTISMTSGGRACSVTNRPGDKIVATVEAPVSGSNGAMIPAGAKVVLEVTSVSQGQSPEQSRIVFRVRALYVGDAAYQVAGTVMPTTDLEKAKVPSSGSSDRKKVIGGAIAGAIIGQVLGHDTKSTVIGAATGAAAGTVAAKAGAEYEGCVREGAPLRLTLAEPIAM